MKKLLSSSLLLLSFLAITVASCFAQQYGPTKVGVGLIYGDEPESAGVQVNGTFRVSPQVAFAPDVSIYFPDNHDTIYDNYWAVNLNGHYIFSAATQYHIYGIGGLNITKVDYAAPISDNKDTKLGINVGIGGEYHLQNFSLFGEIKYVISDLNQVALGVGVRVPLNIK